MSVSTIRAITLLLLLSVLCAADLPSCARAKCVHCAVDFISRMCPTACAGCGQQTQSQLAPQRPPQPPQLFPNQQQFAQSVNSRQVSNEGGFAQPQQIPHQPQQQFPQQAPPQHQPTQITPPAPFAPLNIPLQQPVQFAAPVYQGAQGPIPYPQAQAPAAPIQTATLAPLVEPPKIGSFDPNLSRQPADLAQSLPEYGAARQISQQQPQQGFGLPQQPQQPGYGSQVDNIFNQPNLFQANQQQPGLFGANGQAPAAPTAQTQQQSALLNPFQPFLQQQPGANAFDPFNLFGNLNSPGQNMFNVNQQGIQTQQYGQVQHQGSYMPYNTAQQPQPQPQPQPQQQQQQYNQQPQYNQQWGQQYNQQPQQAQPQPQQQGYNQQQWSQQQQQYNQQYQQQSQAPQQPVHVQAPAQGQQALPVASQQVQQPTPQQTLPQPQPAVAASVDSRPVNFEKYVDPGKRTPLAPPPQAQCPRQPGWQPCISKETANDRFRNCCSRLGEGCVPLCNYDATLATMQLAVLTGRCPLGKVGEVMICASGYQDASQCCEAYGVFEPGYEHCRPYCNPSAGIPEGGLLTEKYKCLVKLSHIQQCFFVSQKP